jgi:hypothetical protein
METNQGKALVQVLSLACLGRLDDVPWDELKNRLSINGMGSDEFGRHNRGEEEASVQFMSARQ